MTKRNVGGKWAVDFTSPVRSAFDLKKVEYISEPVGYIDQKINVHSDIPVADSKLLSKRSWNIAMGPFKSLPMNMFMMYMSGNSISIFPIMIIGMMVFRPIKSLMAYKGTFKMLDGDSQAILQKLVWILGNIIAVGVALYKCHSMGLLPTSPSDWLAFKEHRTRVEYIMGGPLLQPLMR